MTEKHHLEIMDDGISQGELDNMVSWSCPICGDNVKRTLLKGAHQGAFPDDYDYTLYESNPNFLLKIIEHVCAHIQGLTLEVRK